MTPDTSGPGAKNYTAEEVAKVTAAVRLADQDFESSGGSSRHWVADCLLPRLAEAGLVIEAGR